MLPFTSNEQVEASGHAHHMRASSVLEVLCIWAEIREVQRCCAFFVCLETRKPVIKLSGDQ